MTVHPKQPSWVELTGARTTLLIDAPQDAPVVVRCVEVLRADGERLVDDLLAALLVDGFAATPDFAMADATVGAVRVLLRGAAAATIELDGETTDVSASGHPTWYDVLLPGEKGLVLLLGADHTRAQLALQPEIELSEPDVYAGLIGATEDRARVLARLQAAMEEQPGAPSKPEPACEPEPSPAVEVSPPPAAVHDTATWRGEENWASTPPPARSSPEPRAIVPTTPGEGGGGGDSVLIDGAPWVGRPSSTNTPPATPTSTAPAAQAATADPRAPAIPSWETVTPQPDPTRVTGELPVREQQAAEPSVENAELTRSRASLIAAISGDEVNLIGSLCPLRHANAPEAARCRICGAEIEMTRPVMLARPALGHLRLPSGERILLERDVVLGRSPRALDDSGTAHLVKISDSPEVSRNHIRITLDGWQVLLRDLDTVNNTWLTLPGTPRLQLSPKEDYVLEPDSVINVAEELEIVFEVI